jgi:hypothetical protein
MQLFSDHLLVLPFPSNDDGCRLLLDLLGMGFEIGHGFKAPSSK